MRAGGTILTADVSRLLGWAYGPPGSIPRSGTVELAPQGANCGALGRGLIRWFVDFTTVNPVDALYIEAPRDPRHMGAKTSEAALRNMIGLIYVLESVAEMRGVFYRREVDVNKMRAHFIGKPGVRMDRDAWKAAALRQCRILRWEVADDNAAEACGLWSYACAVEAPKSQLQTGPLFTGASAFSAPGVALRPAGGKPARVSSTTYHPEVDDIPD